MNYTLRDISVIIPTFNRPGDLKTTLESFKSQANEVREIIIIDQSKDDETKKLVSRQRTKNLKYIHSDQPSLTRARNLGIKHLSKYSRIVCFSDDDVSLDRVYFKKILEQFNTHPAARGVSGHFFKGVPHNRFERALRKLFYIEHHTKNSARVLSTYGNTYPVTLSKTISAEWLTGFNMSFKREIFNEFQFDERLKEYSLAEDFDFSYRIAKKYPHSLYITPHAKITHRVSSVERYPTKKISYMNQVHHIYLNYKNFNSSPKEKVIFIWALIGITLLRTALFCVHPSKLTYLKLKYYLSSLFYTFYHRAAIKQGQLDLQAT